MCGHTSKSSASGTIWRLRFICLTVFAIIWPEIALAAQDAPHLDGASLGVVWVVPFIGILLSIAILVVGYLLYRNGVFGGASPTDVNVKIDAPATGK